MRAIVLILVLVATFGLNFFVRQAPVLEPFVSKPFVISPYFLRDLAGVMSGMRRVSADIAWIDLLQYYGSPEDISQEEKIHHSLESLSSLLGWELECHHSFEGGLYPELFTYCRRITRLDTNFIYAYKFGAGALAWNQNRPDEAMALLREAVEQNPEDKTFPLYMAAIAYRENLKEKESFEILQEIVGRTQTPNIIKVIVANTYEKRGQCRQALELWKQIYQSGDAMYRIKSEQKLRDLYLKISFKGPRGYSEKQGR